MGKTKKKRFQHSANQPTGLVSVKELEANLEEEHMDDNISTTITTAIEKLQSPNADERESGCHTLAVLVNQPKSIPQILQCGAVKILGPLVIDQSLSVRQTTLGVLRNMSVDGGEDACEAMVKQDIMTPLTTLLQKHYVDWTPQKSSEGDTDIFLQLIHLIWNLCESSAIAVSIFNRHKLLPLLLPCLQANVFGYTIAITAAQCIYSVSEDNEEVITQLSQGDIVSTFEQTLGTQHENTEQLLLRVLSAGILYNISTDLSTTKGELLKAVVNVLAHILEIDLMQNLGKIVTELSNASAMKNGVGDLSDLDTKHKELDSLIEETQNLISAQQLALELVANLCCQDEEESWEDLDSDGSVEELGEAAMEEDIEGAAVLNPLCVTSELNAIFLSVDITSKVLMKCTYPADDICDSLRKNRKGCRVLKNMLSLQSRGLLCLNNLVSTMSIEALGGQENLHNICPQLYTLMSSQPVVQNVDLLEASSSALRAVTQKLIETESTQFAQMEFVSKLQPLYEMSQKCDVPQVRANGLRIVSNAACAISEQEQLNPILKEVGEFFLAIACNDKELWVVAESLDCIFDVFGDDKMDPVIQEIGMIEKLTTLSPMLKAKIHQQKRNLGEHFPIISTARTNLIRFIKYKSKK